MDLRIRLLLRVLAVTGGLVLALLAWAGAALAQSPSPPGGGAGATFSYTVQDGDSLWAIAERLYGDGSRYPELLAANTGRRMGDGRTFTNANNISTGWQLQIAPPANAGSAHAEYVVQSGDTLSGVAARVLGSPDRWPDLFDANRGATMDDGRVLSNPNIIWQGLHLKVPSATATAAPPPSTPVAPPTPAGPASASLPAAAPAPAEPAASSGPSPVASGQVAGAAALSCPGTWICADIGAPGRAGSQQVTGGSAPNSIWRIIGAGIESVVGVRDQFHFAWRTLIADGAISARVGPPVALDGGANNPGAKAGLMLRQSALPGSPYYALVINGNQTLNVDYRATLDQPGAFVLLPAPDSAANLTATGQLYFKVARAATSFSASLSADGVAWNELPASRVDIPNLRGPMLAGMTVSSLDSNAASTASFGSVTFTPPPENP